MDGIQLDRADCGDPELAKSIEMQIHRLESDHHTEKGFAPGEASLEGIHRR